MSLTKRCIELANTMGADFVGIADLSTAREFICRQGGEHLASYPYALSLGIRLMDTLMDALPQWKEEFWVVHTFKYHAYDKVNDRLDAVASRIASLLQNAGYRTLPVPAFSAAKPETMESLFSHKVAAHLAGLGWIGKSGLLVTPQAGPRVRWATVLTMAPIEPTGPILKERCGNCTKCADICPVQACTGRNFRQDEPREMRFNYKSCLGYLKERGKDTGERYNICSLCVYACPFGRKDHSTAEK